MPCAGGAKRGRGEDRNSDANLPSPLPLLDNPTPYPNRLFAKFGCVAI